MLRTLTPRENIRRVCVCSQRVPILRIVLVAIRMCAIGSKKRLDVVALRDEPRLIPRQVTVQTPSFVRSAFAYVDQWSRVASKDALADYGCLFLDQHASVGREGPGRCQFDVSKTAYPTCAFRSQYGNVKRSEYWSLFAWIDMSESSKPPSELPDSPRYPGRDISNRSLAACQTAPPGRMR